MVDRKHEFEDHDADDNDALPKPMKTARFQSDVPSPLHSPKPVPPFARTDSGFDSLDPRSSSPSIADSDEDNDDYDWSGEEDLVDEEAKFEQNMGVLPKERWGFRK